MACEILEMPPVDRRAQLLAQLKSLRAQIAALDQDEPADMDAAEYEDWAEAHEELEDLVDETLELLDLETGG